jgi:capsid protein
MSQEIQMAKLYDPAGHVITEWHPGFEARKRSIQFSEGYNPRPERRGSSGGLYQNTGSETWMKSRDRKKASYDAVDQVTHTWIGGVVARIVLYVLGRLHAKSECGDPDVAKLYQDYFHGWCGDEPADDETMRCDLSGRHRFLKMAQMGFFSFFTRGDHGFVEVAPEFSPTGEFCLQSISGDRIGNPQDGRQDENYIDGIWFDPTTGRIDHYDIYRRTRTNQYVDKQEVPAGSFIHLFDPDWDDEYRGRSKLTRGLNDNRDISEWIEFEKGAMKIQSQYALGITTRDPFNGNSPAAFDGKTRDGTPAQDAIWGKQMRFAEGEGISMITPASRPSGGNMVLMETLVRRIAISFKLSYGFVWNLATLGGAPQRIEVQGDLRTIQEWQQNVIAARLLNRTWRRVIAQGIAQGALPPHPMWKKVEWNFGPYITADLGYEMEADISAVRHNLIKVESVCAKYGNTAEDVISSNMDTFNTAIQKGSEKGVPVEAVAADLYANGTNLKAAFMTPTPVPPPEPGTVEALGEKVLAEMIDIFIAVGEGKIDRQSAVNTLVDSLHVPRAKAERMVPQEPAEEDLNRAAGLTPSGEHAPVVAGPKTASSNGSTSKKNGASKS